MSIKLVRPQLAASDIPDLNTLTKWPKIIQPKLDGICCLAVDGVAMSRTMKPIPNKYVQKVFKELNLTGLHGELMVRGDFNDVQSAIMSEDGEPDFYYVVYDKWDSNEDYSGRESYIGGYISKLNHKRVSLIHGEVVTDKYECTKWLETYVASGYEGAILRDPNSLYKQGRHTLKSEALLKLKHFMDDEATIIGFEEKLTNENEKKVDERGYSKRSSHKANMVPANTLGALIVNWNGVEFKIGSGFDDKVKQELWDNRYNLVGKPVTFKYQGVSKYGVPRFPIYKALRLELV